MALTDTVKNALDSQVFAAASGLPDQNITHKHTPVEQTNNRGEVEQGGTAWTEDTINGVVWNSAEYLRGIEQFGEPNTGDLDMALSSDISVSGEDRFVINGIEYAVDEVGPNPIGGSNVGTILRLTRVKA